MNYREISRKLIQLGCQEHPRRGGGSHRIWFNPAQDNRFTVVPNWGARDLKLGTVRAAVRQLGLDWEEFKRS